MNRPCKDMPTDTAHLSFTQREKTRVIADHHANLAKTVEGSIVQHLHKLRAEIKAHIKNIQMDTGKLAAVSIA